MVNQAETQFVTQKYRDEGEDFVGNVHQDKRVYRGSTMDMGGHGTTGGSPGRRSPGRKTRAKPAPEPNPFAIDLPKPERIPVDLLSHLVESKPVKTEASCGSQTDTFQPRPLPPRTFPRKTGVDVATHIPENELFKFDQEVQPLLDVLVTKTIEQAIMEVEEEQEMEAMSVYKQEWFEDRRIARQEELAEVEAERQRMAATDQLKKKRRAVREDELRKKMMCQFATRNYLTSLCSSAVQSCMRDHALFPHEDRRMIATQFLPWVHGKVSEKIGAIRESQAAVDEMVRTNCMERFVTRQKKLAELSG